MFDAILEQEISQFRALVILFFAILKTESEQHGASHYNPPLTSGTVSYVSLKKKRVFIGVLQTFQSNYPQTVVRNIELTANSHK